jgi:hypothetical protein
VLIYHPAFDAYHCAFRMLAVTEKIKQLEFAKLRILDFYLSFPGEIASVQLPHEHIEIKKVARAARNQYRGPISAFRTFREMEPIHLAAARMLAAWRVIDAERLQLGLVLRTETQIPTRLVEYVWRFLTEGPLTEYVLTGMSAIRLSGVGGLKQRTALMEHRYDTP